MWWTSASVLSGTTKTSYLREFSASEGQWGGKAASFVEKLRGAEIPSPQPWPGNEPGLTNRKFLPGRVISREQGKGGATVSHLIQTLVRPVATTC